MLANLLATFQNLVSQSVGQSTKPIPHTNHLITRSSFTVLCVCVWLCVCMYTGCPGGNVPDFGRMLLMLKYTDITKNTYIRS